jgi:hypothetical protein
MALLYSSYAVRKGESSALSGGPEAVRRSLLQDGLWRAFG